MVRPNQQAECPMSLVRVLVRDCGGVQQGWSGQQRAQGPHGQDDGIGGGLGHARSQGTCHGHESGKKTGLVSWCSTTVTISVPVIPIGNIAFTICFFYCTDMAGVMQMTELAEWI